MTDDDCPAPERAFEPGIDHPAQMREFAAVVRPAACVVTLVGGEHNRSLGTLEVTRRVTSGFDERSDL